MRVIRKMRTKSSKNSEEERERSFSWRKQRSFGGKLNLKDEEEIHRDNREEGWAGSVGEGTGRSKDSITDAPGEARQPAPGAQSPEGGNRGIQWVGSRLLGYY